MLNEYKESRRQSTMIRRLNAVVIVCSMSCLREKSSCFCYSILRHFIEWLKRCDTINEGLDKSPCGNIYKNGLWKGALQKTWLAHHQWTHQIRNLKDGVQIGNTIFNSQAPIYLTEMFARLPDTCKRELRNTKTDLTVPCRKSAFGQKSFSYKGAKLWNDLSVEVKSSKSYEIFKKRINNANTECWVSLSCYC